MGERVRALLAFGFGQKRLVDPEERARGRPPRPHLRRVPRPRRSARSRIFGMGFAGAEFHLPLLGEDAPLGRAYLVREGPRRPRRARRRRRVPLAPARHEAGPRDALDRGRRHPPLHRRAHADGHAVRRARERLAGLQHSAVRDPLRPGLRAPDLPLDSALAPARLRSRRSRVSAGLSPEAIAAVGAVALLAPPRPHPRLPERPPVREALPHHHRAPERLLRAAPARRRAAQARPRGGGRELRHRDREGPLLEGGLGRLQLHRVRPLPDPLPDLRHREAAQPQGGEPGHPPPPRRHGDRRSPPLARAKEPAAREAAVGEAARASPPSCRPRPSGPAPPAAGARPPARCSSRTCRASSTCAATRCSSSPPSPTRPPASSRGSRPRATPGASARTSAPSGARTSTCPRVADGEPSSGSSSSAAPAPSTTGRRRSPAPSCGSCARRGSPSPSSGEEETCTGDAARRLGNEYLFQMQAQANVETS